MYRYADQYEIIKLYLSNLSVESPHTGRLPAQINQPGIEIDIQPAIARVALHTYEVAVRVSVAARSGTVPLFLIQLRQAGLFVLKSAGDAERESLLRQVLPQAIFPAARSAVAASILMAGYQPIVLDHIAIEDFFRGVEIEDKRPPADSAVAAEKKDEADETAAPSWVAALFRKGARIRVRPAVWRGAAILLAAVVPLALWISGGGGQWLSTAGIPDQKMLAGAAIEPRRDAVHAAGKVTAPPPQAVAPLQIEGRDVEQLAKIGSDWMAAQDGDKFTVEWLRSGDIRRIADFTPIDDGLPLFLVRVAGAQSPEYAVMSGIYPDEPQARLAADKSGLPYWIRKFRDAD